MRVCIPTVDEAGLEGRLSTHFARAPYFTIVDTERWEVDVLPNINLRREHGMCNPLVSLEEAEVDAVICRGLGHNALRQWQEAGVPVYHSEAPEVESSVRTLLSEGLKRYE